MKIIITILLSLVLTHTLYAKDAAILLQKNCASCHLLTTPTPDIIPTLKAPAMEAVVFHIKLAIDDPKNMRNFIVDYVLNPKASKSVCESNKVRKFGVMPSQKGKISTTDLEMIANYIIVKYPSKDFENMIKEIQTNDKIAALVNSPFLINKTRLPHLTKILLHNWDKASLGLNQEQKTKLLLVRKETLSAVKKIKKEVAKLEKEIIEIVVDNEDLTLVDTKLDALAKLKIEGTKIHIHCLRKSISILSEEQLELLLPFWDS